MIPAGAIGRRKTDALSELVGVVSLFWFSFDCLSSRFLILRIYFLDIEIDARGLGID